MTLEDLLRMKVSKTWEETGDTVLYSPDFRVAVQGENDDGVHIIIHADGHNSETLGFVVQGNILRSYRDVTEGQRDG